MYPIVLEAGYSNSGRLLFDQFKYYYEITSQTGEALSTWSKHSGWADLIDCHNTALFSSYVAHY